MKRFKVDLAKQPAGHNALCIDCDEGAGRIRHQKQMRIFSPMQVGSSVLLYGLCKLCGKKYRDKDEMAAKVIKFLRQSLALTAAANANGGKLPEA